MNLRKPRKPTGFIFYKGPSMLDGKPIVAILTLKSRNKKTGSMYQTWILRSDISPLQAARTGADYSICGNCPARGTVSRVKGRMKNSGRYCYVQLERAPNSVYKTFKRRRYPTLTIDKAREMIAGGKVRGGSYGDPAAVPFHVWQSLLDGMPTGNAYTHQWRQFPELAAFCMASVDSAEERAHAKLLGFRTFRVRGEHEPIGNYEIPCPASEEAGFKTTCDLCRACGGNSAKAKVDMSIIVHGSGKAAAFDVAHAH